MAGLDDSLRRFRPYTEPVPGAPTWMPSIDDERSLARLQRAVKVVLVAGLLVWFSAGANRPPDPSLDPGAVPSTPAAGSPGGPEAPS